MDLTQVGSYPPPYGGQSVHIKNLKDFLVSQGHKCLVLNTGENRTVREERIINIVSGLDLEKRLWGNRSDLIHVHCGRFDTFSKLYHCLAVSKIFRRQKIVATIHSGGFVDDVVQLHSIKKRLFLLILRQVDLLIGVNELIRDFLIQGGIREEKVLLIPAYSLRVDLTDAKLPEAVEVFLSQHNPVLSCMGCFEPQYRHDLAVEALKSLKASYPAAGLVIMGSGRENRISDSAMKNPDENGILILKDMEKTLCLKVVSRSSVFLRPTDYDGDAISVREALAIRTPVVASSVGTRPEGVCQFKPGDRQELALRLKEVLSGVKPAVPRRMRIEDEENLQSILAGYRKTLKTRS